MGCDAFVKHENHLPTGSFKIRGALNFFQTIPKEDVANGVLVSTRGNHGLAMAWAGQWFHTPCTVVVPENNNPEINRIIESFGAELIVHGHDFYDAQFYCDELVAAAGYYYVEQGNEPEMLNGIGTMGLEIFEDLPDVDVIICPIGGGGGCASLLRVAQAINPAGGDHRRTGRKGTCILPVAPEGRVGGPGRCGHHSGRTGGTERIPASLCDHEGPYQRGCPARARTRCSKASAWRSPPRTTSPKAPVQPRSWLP
ncbi:MAG: pyridoxal-phosphate dependent enzyme [Desulfosudis oleivorans]|nr:pyridoxal-phosphate dependent enzyme [Desulfosudis oleivorans]